MPEGLLDRLKEAPMLTLAALALSVQGRITLNGHRQHGDTLALYFTVEVPTA